MAIIHENPMHLSESKTFLWLLLSIQNIKYPSYPLLMLVWWPSEQVPGHLPIENFNSMLHELRDHNPRLCLYHRSSFDVPPIAAVIAP